MTRSEARALIEAHAKLPCEHMDQAPHVEPGNDTYDGATGPALNEIQAEIGPLNLRLCHLKRGIFTLRAL
jgi:hypothetical protein